MSEYYTQPFHLRYAALGDTAETAFLTTHPKAHRLGLSRPQLSVIKMDPNLRYTPDFMLEDGAYEVMGFSSRGNGSLKLKFEKADALRSWDMLIPTHLWVYDSGRKRYWCAPIRDWLDACYHSGERLHFADNHRPYWNLPHAHFPGQPAAVTEAA